MRQNLQHNSWFKIFFKILLVTVLLLLLTQVNIDYYLVRPGTVVETSEVINVKENGQEYGNLFLTTVNQAPSNIVTFLYGSVSPNVELRPGEEVIPPEIDTQEYHEMMQQYMIDSQNMAKVVALDNMGYNVDLKGEGVRLLEISEDSPAQGILEPNDLIIEIDDKDVILAEQFVNYISDMTVGDEVELTVKRKEERIVESIETIDHPENPTQGFLGVYIKSENWEPVTPVEIDIDAGEIGGPSAGLMFVLEIMNQLTENDLTDDSKIAGTGAINLDGTVTPVGGVNHKVRAAEEIDAKYFFVPKENYKEAEQAATTIEIVKVENVSEAKEFLEEL
ncbi:PDZ domain-containing protein [Natranaerobius trueperi]|uniref:endopeptidase La n=1 Tax=Natranaerobius trueperi TaxID=759412 RepID=A0A226BYT4_9FIRM|nr:PDZ domain-containing protein [Natranaerobius trueperi]OWZ84183.1 signal protein PDZ [Natranaerobius trueperi]